MTIGFSPINATAAGARVRLATSNAARNTDSTASVWNHTRVDRRCVSVTETTPAEMPFHSGPYTEAVFCHVGLTRRIARSFGYSTGTCRYGLAPYCETIRPYAAYDQTSVELRGHRATATTSSTRVTISTVRIRSARRHRPTPSASPRAANASASSPARPSEENCRVKATVVADAETSTSVRTAMRSAAVGAPAPAESGGTARSLPDPP